MSARNTSTGLSPERAHVCSCSEALPSCLLYRVSSGSQGRASPAPPPPPASEAMASKAPAFGGPSVLTCVSTCPSCTRCFPPACQCAAAFAGTHLSAFLLTIVLLIFLFVSFSLWQLPWQPPAPASVLFPPLPHSLPS